MKTTTKLLAILIVHLSIMGLRSQESKLERADKKFDQLAYMDAMDIYLEVAESGHRSRELFQRLGDTYYFNSRYEDAAKWYGELFASEKEIPPIYHLRYAQSLRAIGNTATAGRFFDEFAEKSGITDSGKLTAGDYLRMIEENSDRYEVFPLDINTDGVDFGSAFRGDGMVFASTKDTTSLVRRRSAWDGMSYLDLYQTRIDSSGNPETVEKLQGDVNTRYHESTPTFTKDGKTMYFTRNNTTPGTKRDKKNEIQHLKIYRAEYKDGKWNQIEELPINGEDFSTAHPVLDPEGNSLYFVSDRPGSLGETDIYRVPMDGDGSFGTVENLGPSINTKGRESFPFISKDNELYFASDGHYGLGGYDIFYARIKEDGTFGTLLNVGRPINSPSDDVSFVIRDSLGYISSNRKGGRGHDDIYRFIEKVPIKNLLKSKIYGIVTDTETGEVLENADIQILDSANKTVATLRTNTQGYYEQEVDIEVSYIIKGTKADYEGDDAFSEKGRKEREHNLRLKPNAPVGPGDDLSQLLNIIIYFDLDKSDIRPDAQVELEKIIATLKRYKDIRLDIRSHTDSRANDAYNEALSDRRVRSTIDYIVKGGIDRSRLTGKGYGEYRLVNQCGNGVRCSEREHQENRRSEFIVIND